ncbi:MAG TPA: hypothetical protein VHD15_05935 [Hyphomicrobiales bacterium]|nr:hypothetical protein [Hyphomicrobiales bacterium]
MNKLLLVVLLTLGAATAAEAQGRRPDSLALSCGQAKALVSARGAVVMTTGGPDIYDRYVRDGGFCATSLTTQPAYIATRNRRQCFVGYRCVPIVVPNNAPVPPR